MSEAILPTGTENIPIRISSNSGETFDGTLVIKRWTDQETRKRALKRTLKIVGTVFACSLIGLFVHILLLLIIPTLLLTVILSFSIYLRLARENATFFFANGTCPYCRQPQRLRPYLNTQFDEKMTLQCPQCGQTVQVSPAL